VLLQEYQNELRDEPRRPSPRRRFAVPLAALLIGLGAGWQWAGLRLILSAVIDPLAKTTTMLTAIALLAAAAGPWVPVRILPAAARLSRRLCGRSAPPEGNGPTFWMLRAVHERDESMLWLAVAVLSSLSACLVLVTTGLLIVAGRAYRTLIEDFFWTGLTLSGLEWVGTAVLTAPAWGITAITLAALPPLLAAQKQDPRSVPGLLAAFLAGTGLACLAHDWLADRGLSGEQQLLMASLPLFALAALSVFRSQESQPPPTFRGDQPEEPPELARGEHLTLLALAAWGTGTVLVGTGWVEGMSQTGIAGAALTRLWPSFYLLVLASGLAAGLLKTRMRPEDHCGRALWLAGVAAGAGVTLACRLPEGWAGLVIQFAVICVPAGWALGQAGRAWLAHSGVRARGWGQLSTAVLVGTAVGLMIGRWAGFPHLGPMGTMAAGALILLSVGGIVIIFEESSPSGIRHRRLALVFASLAAAILLFPADIQRRARASRQQSIRTAPRGELESVLDMALPGARRFCVIGLDVTGPAQQLTRAAGPAALVSLSYAFSPQHERATSAPDLASWDNAFRALRLDRGVYDLIYQRGPLQQTGGRFPGYTLEWFERLVRHLAPGGVVVVDVPLAGLTPDAISVIAATFQRAAGRPGHWNIRPWCGEWHLRLYSTFPGQVAELSEPFPQTAPLRILLPVARPAGTHSLRRDRVTATLVSGPGQDRDLLEWLTSQRTEAMRPLP
jgi:hypothetical protein